MMDQEKKEKIRRIVMEVTEIEDYADDEAFLDRVGVDSLSMIEIISRVEKVFNISVPEKYVSRFTNLNQSSLAVQDIIDQTN
ncbi:MAG: acyl carrier protein [Paenibacillus dendritiformis]|uniref:acyl carrier protein n=1 Tax=Paenibacillus dendritiformis TaxID=130049 RepID=UPI00143DC43F|nr:acyl carrier protein [Paenibacillus dendritiformis]MDU5145887.1 acyl carrier protein [Paenibacillus dendritiformis]NKI21920.1 acyl carrier protein [Paenibacillus dendritiformis]NRF97450.1 acyl carrier protein [Paenibacillus dendritiformis]GIO71156.1 hypothetical protein J27TS7_06700 [Paenibacillus dendritiformis]